MPGNVTSTEALGQPSIPASADYAAVVIGATSSSPLAAGLVSAPYSVPSSLVSAYGLGDAVDCATQAITATQGNPAPPPICTYRTPATTPGVRGVTLTTSGIVGTAVVTKTAATNPVGTYEPRVRVADDGNNGLGGIVGSTGIVLEGSLDNGRTWLASEQLGTAVTWKIRIPVDGTPVDTGIQYDIGPSTTNAAYVALAVELRADALAHFANAVAHDGADATAAALITLGAPTTVSEATAVLNQVRLGYESHRKNITTVHDGPDRVNTITLAAATTTVEGILLAIQLKSVMNLHLAAGAVALPAAAAGLLAATATVASPVTVLAAAMLAGGIVALDLNPRRLTFATAGGTASDAPASVTITGFDLDGNAQTETALVLAQTAATVTSAKAWKGTGLSVAYLAADGTGATIAIGYAAGVHNSADTTNTTTAADPTYGTLVTGDVWYESITTPPMFAVADLYAAGPPATGAFAGIAASASTFAIVAISEPVQASDLATITAGLNYLASSTGGGKRVALLCRFRNPTAAETDAQYVAAARVFLAANSDNRITCCFGSGWLTDAFRAFVYFRSGMPAVLARMQSFAVIPGAIGEKMAQHPGYVARGPLEGFSLVDLAGNPVSQAHDEATAGGIDGPINGEGGGLTFYYQRLASIVGTYVSRAPVMYPGLSKVLTWMDRRVMNGIEMIAVTLAWLSIQGANIFDPVTFALDADIRDALQTSIAKAIRDRYSAEFQNPDDPNLVSINETVTVDGAQVTINGTVHPRLFGYTNTINLTFSATR